MIGQEIFVQNEKYTVEKFIGKGKAAYSYLISNGQKQYVYKQMHYEHCEHYNFGDNKLMAEIWAYGKLKEAGIRIPELIEYNEEKQYLIKQYVDGKTAAELIAENNISEENFKQAFQMAGCLYAHNLNVDFFPTNFVYEDGEIYCVDYESNPYIEEWDLETWGIYFWLNEEGMKEHLEKGMSEKLCMPDSPKPIKTGLEERAQYLIDTYSMKVKHRSLEQGSLD